MATLKPSSKGRPAGEGTRARILDCSRVLFNAHGTHRVTTAMIAQAAGINEGNLYYHFERKEHLIVALAQAWLDEHETLARRRFRRADGGVSYKNYVAGWFGLIWRHHFLYRDTSAVLDQAPGARDLLLRVSERGRENVERVLRSMSRFGVIAIDDAALARLSVNVYIVCAHWFGYARATRHGEPLTEAMIMEGCAQVDALVMPYREAALAGARVAGLAVARPDRRVRRMAEAAD